MVLPAVSLGERFAAKFALIRAFVAVQSLMLLEVGFSCELLVAKLAREKRRLMV